MQFGLDIFSSILEDHLGGLLALLVSVGILVPSTHILNVARGIISGCSHERDGNDGGDDDVIDKDGIVEEKVLHLFARIALHGRVNKRIHRNNIDDEVTENNRDAETMGEDRRKKRRNVEGMYDQLLHALPISVFHLCLEPMGCQGLVWSEGDVLHYWKYTVFPSIKKVSTTEGRDGKGGGDEEGNSCHEEHFSGKGDPGDDQDDDDELYLNKFYTPIVSATITLRWSELGFLPTLNDFDDLKVVRQRRFIEKEREIEERSREDDQHDNANSDSETEKISRDISLDDTEEREESFNNCHDSINGNQGEGADKKKKKSIVGRRGFSSLGFTSLGIAGCVSAPDLDPNVMPRARARKGKADKKIGGESENAEDGDDDGEEEEEGTTGHEGSKNEDVLLQDDWISIPGSQHHTYKGETFESLQQEDWTNSQVRIM